MVKKPLPEARELSGIELAMIEINLEKQKEEIDRLQNLLEGNDGMSVKDIRNQFVDLHRDFLNTQTENKRLREALKFYVNDELYPDEDLGEIARQALGGDPHDV
ncbi:MAG: hypothetical protein RR595_13790 [Lysinibacillus sp.]